MVKIQILTRHGNSIGVEVEDLDEARKLLSNQFVVVNSQDRFTAIAVSSIDLFDAVAVPESDGGSGGQL